MITVDNNILALVVPLFGILVVNVASYMKARLEATQAMQVRVQNRKWAQEDAEKILNKTQEAIDSSKLAATQSEKAVEAANHMTTKLMEQNGKITDLHERQLKSEEMLKDDPPIKSVEIKDKLGHIEEIGQDSNDRIKKIEQK